MAKNYLGIDLGTTESTVAVISIEKRRDIPIEKLRSLSIYQYNSRYELDKDLHGLQSSLYIDRDNSKIYTGEYAKNLYSNGNNPLNTIRSIKTRIGGESMIQVPLASETRGMFAKIKNMLKNNTSQNLAGYDMTELSAILLKTIRESIDKQIIGKLEKVTITIPAGFGSDERNATIKAAELAGFKNVNLLDEPTAVLLNFLNSEDTLDSIIDDDFFNEPKTILVYDIGGGTLDISIAKVEDEDGDFKVDILGRSKRMDFGGDDIDKYIASYFLSEFEKINPSISERSEEEQAVIVSRIVSNAEKAKIAFSKNISKYLDNERRKKRIKESVNFEIIDGLKVTDLIISDEILKEILFKVIGKNGKLLNPLDKSLKESKLDKKDIDLVLLTGGSGKFYLVEEVLNSFFENSVNIVDFTGQSAVSKGAAIHSYNHDNEDLKKIDISDIMSDSIFIKNGNKFDELIPHDTKLDVSGKYEYTFERLTNRIEIFLYYGSKNEEIYKYKEITGVFKTLDRFYEKNEKITLQWEFDENKTVKIFLEGMEIINSKTNSGTINELIDKFKLN